MKFHDPCLPCSFDIIYHQYHLNTGVDNVPKNGTYISNISPCGENTLNGMVVHSPDGSNNS